MNTKTAYNHYTRLLSKIKAEKESAIRGRKKHADWLESAKKNVWEDPVLKKCPSWVGVSLRERSSAFLEEVHRYWLVWAFEAPSGVKTWDELTDAEKLPYTQEGKTGNHYWLKLANRSGMFFDVENGTVEARYVLTQDTF